MEPPVINGDRPWRKLGASICVLLAVMFVLGISFLDASRAPGLYLLYWSVMMVLVAWVCALAVKDVLHTRRLVSEWRKQQERQRRRMPGASARPEPTDARP